MKKIQRTLFKFILIIWWNKKVDIYVHAEILNYSIGSGSNFFDPDWVNFLLLRLGWVRSAIFELGLENLPQKIPIISIFFHSGQNGPGSKSGLLFTAGQKYARVGSGPSSTKLPNVYFWKNGIEKLALGKPH